MASWTVRLPQGRPLRLGASWSRRERPHLHLSQISERTVHALSLAALALAVLVASLVLVARSDDEPATAQPLIAISLPGLGTGAPASVGAQADVATGVISRLGNPAEPRARVTGRRYATHLVGAIVDAPRQVSVPLRNTDQIVAAITTAQQPEVVLRTAQDEVAEAPQTDGVLRARLGIPANEALPPYFTYQVQRGDTVEKIARRFGLETNTVLFNNWEIGNPDRLEAGTELTLPTKDGVVYTVRLGDTLLDIAENYAADVDAILEFEGNELSSPGSLREGATILLVGGAASLSSGGGAGIASGGSGSTVVALPAFRWPVGGVLTDFFGSGRGNGVGFHTGIDLSAPTGTFVGAAAAGVVIQAGWDGSFGQSVLVDHGGGAVTRYAHLSYINVFLGQYVDPGDLIGFVGATGYATGPHLHFEIILGGAPVNPLAYLN